MKKTAILTMIFSILIVTYSMNGFAQDLTGQITALEQKADRVQNQINQAKQQAQAGLDQQVKVVQATIDSLINQRVQLDSHIAKLESQMEEMKKNAQSNLERQVQQYKVELAGIKQQISGMVTQKNADAAAKLPAPQAGVVSSADAAKLPAPQAGAVSSAER
jgi:chromosome segregation ATPase